MRIDSRLHCTDIANPLRLGGQQWRRREKRKLRRSRRRKRLARRSSRRRLWSSICRTNRRPGSHGPADVERVITTDLGWPAPVNCRGRRRDGGVSFTLATTPRDGDDETGRSPISLRHSAGRLNPSTISPTPSDIFLKLFLAPWIHSMALFSLDV